MHPPVEPSISKAAFSCPHCGAYTTQQWFTLFASELDDKAPTPFLPGKAQRQTFEQDRESDPELMREMLEWVAKHESGQIFLESTSTNYLSESVSNLHICRCHHCRKFAVWVRDRLVFPESKATIIPNQDLPGEIIQDFEEARGIVNSSPRGAAALLRLCIQKLCTHLLGPDSKDINNDIGALARKGLDPIVQQSLDIVRVIGNESVHPGTMDLKDDRDTAITLFHLVNSIADQLISHPKKVQSIYNSLPQGKLAGIQARGKNSGPPSTP
jgi:predicted RNA-binding Zn-ribbon protein involved in translation (DUF1610 family)